MKKCLFVVLVMLIVLTSCSKDSTYKIEVNEGVKNFSNNGTPADLEFDPNLNLTMKISGTESDEDATERIFSKVLDMVVDSESNIYIADDHSSTIKKFDLNGKFVNSFGGLGNGPGEYQMLGDMNICNDTIVVFDQASYRRVKFDKNGDFLGFKYFHTDAKPIFLEQVSKDRNLGLKIASNMIDGIVYLIVEVQMYDSKYNDIFSIENRKIEIDTNNPQINPTDMFTPFSFSNKNIFVAEVNENLFKYNVYDLDGNLEKIVKMNYKKSEISKDRIELFKSAHRNSDGTSLNKLERAFNKAIEDIYCDKLDRVWVKKAKTDESVAGGYIEFSIFKNGVYLNNYKFKG
ncbi:MAG: 6-bladed beta-propeller, partial [Candidatus Delongbacteria bacterium]|nr:6-bladed beta-propeller [Candidatus Delongbacteria bacterium]